MSDVTKRLVEIQKIKDSDERLKAKLDLCEEVSDGRRSR
jgi:hypothetical protein